MFYLAEETEHFCNRAYAQTTRFELGEHCMLTRFTPARLVVGVHDRYPNATYTRKTIAKKYPRIRLVANDLIATCDATLNELARLSSG